MGTQRADSMSDPSRIGDLLVSGGFVSRRELEVALELSERLHLPLCQILQRQQRLDRLEKNAILKLQADVRRAAKQASPRAADLQCRLGDLLLSEGQIDPEELNTALKQQKTTKTPLGMVLLKRGTISLDRLTRFLRLQQKLIAAGSAALLMMGSPCFAGAPGEGSLAWGSAQATVKKASPHSLSSNWRRPGFNETMTPVRYAREDTLFRSKNGKMLLRLTETGVEFRKFF